ncbi:Leu/Phe/Val dehydrogenase [Legionella sp. W05-934-2]|uniref:Leu/Phe/Val dehydrogenase n=1 Tax=Legionella sp. W05-934-2 TaxID=1198649 RepID=UPI003461F55D
MMASQHLSQTNHSDNSTQIDIMDYALSHDFGDIHLKTDTKTGMMAIIAIHDTTLGPALGGCRFIEYPNSNAAIYDAMRLARGMSYKAACVNLPLGGGKSVIIKPPHAFDREAYFNEFGQFIESLNGRYITALDSGTELADMDTIGKHTRYVASLSEHNGDPSPYTALGVLRGIEAAVEFKLGQTNLSGLHIAIQGLGHVGYQLAKFLHERGAKLTVSDIKESRLMQAQKEFGATVVDTHSIHQVACDVFSPCALGAGLNDKTIPELNTGIIAGAANNQLAHSYHGQSLFERGILFAVDYVINAGGLIYAYSHYNNEREVSHVEQRVNNIKTSLLEFFERSERKEKPVNEIADQYAREKIAAAKQK